MIAGIMDIINPKNDISYRFVSVHPHSPRRLSLYVIEVTQQCNFRCKYCCYSGEYEERRVHNPLSMTEVTIEDTINFILKTNCQDRDVRVTFYGGEALLQLKVIKEFVTRLYRAFGNRIIFGISTNGYLLTHELIDWICEFPKFNIYVSLDAYEELHNRNRITVHGENTFNKIVSNLEYFSEKYSHRYKESVFFLVTLTSWTELPEVSRRWSDISILNTRPPIHLSFVMPRGINDVERMIDTIDERKKVLDQALIQYQIGEVNLLTSKFKEWTDLVSQNSQMTIKDKTILVNTCVEDFYRTFISSEGDIYICERFSKGFKIGKVSDGELSMAEPERIEEEFIRMRNQRCGKCDIAKICSMCPTVLSHSPRMLDAICHLERKMMQLFQEYAWKRRQVDRKKQLMAISEVKNLERGLQ